MRVHAHLCHTRADTVTRYLKVVCRLLVLAILRSLRNCAYTES